MASNGLITDLYQLTRVTLFRLFIQRRLLAAAVSCFPAHRQNMGSVIAG